MVTTKRPRLLGIAGVALALGGCVASRAPEPSALVVRDLSAVAGCRFIGTTQAPGGPSDVRLALSQPQNVAELARRAALRGGTHLYVVNEAAFWGSSTAAGSIYACRSR